MEISDPALTASASYETPRAGGDVRRVIGERGGRGSEQGSHPAPPGRLRAEKKAKRALSLQDACGMERAEAKESWNTSRVSPTPLTAGAVECFICGRSCSNQALYSSRPGEQTLCAA